MCFLTERRTGNELLQHTNSEALVWCVLHISYCGVTLNEARWTDNNPSARLQKYATVMGESSNPNVNSSVDKHVSAKPVPFLQGGGRKGKLYSLFPFHGGKKVYVRTKPDAELNILPSYSR